MVFNVDATTLAIIILGIGALLLLLVTVFRKSKVTAKGALGNIFKGEFSAEDEQKQNATTPTQPQAQAPPATGATLHTKQIKDANVLNADQSQGGTAAMNVDGAITGSTVINVTGSVGNIGGVFGHAPQPPAGAKPAESSTKVLVAKVLESRFSLGEVETLCFDLGIDKDDIEGKTKPEKVRALIEHCDDIEKLDQLIALIKNARGNTGL